MKCAKLFVKKIKIILLRAWTYVLEMNCKSRDSSTPRRVNEDHRTPHLFGAPSWQHEYNLPALRLSYAQCAFEKVEKSMKEMGIKNNNNYGTFNQQSTTTSFPI